MVKSFSFTITTTNPATFLGFSSNISNVKLSSPTAMVKPSGQASSSNAADKQLSPLTQATLQIVKEKEQRDYRRYKGKKPDSDVKYFDLSDPRYGWLLPGWIVEERRMATGRLYKYYYDQTGRQYRTLREVKYAWEQCGIICLDI